MKHTARNIAAGLAFGALGLAGIAQAQTMESRTNTAANAASVQVLQNGTPVSTTRVREIGTMTDARGNPFYHVALQPQGGAGELTYEASFGGIAPSKLPTAARETTGLLEGYLTQNATPANGTGLQLTVDGLKVNTLASSSANFSYAAEGVLSSFGADRLHPFVTGITGEEELLGQSLLRSARGDFIYQGQKCTEVKKQFTLADNTLKLRFTPTCAGLPSAGTLELLVQGSTYSGGRPIDTSLSRGASTINAAIDSTLLFPVIGDTQYAQGDSDVQVFDYSGGTQNMLLNVAALNGQSTPAFCERDNITACLLNGEYRAVLEMRNFANPPETFQGQIMAFPGGRAESDQAAFFDSFNPGNFELGVKMVDACSFNNKYWVFTGGLTNARYDISVTDTVTGQVKTYSNPAGTFPLSTGDTSAFPCIDGVPSCVRSDSTACLIGSRFKVESNMWNFETPPRLFQGKIMQFSSDRAESDQAAFYDSFNPGNFEWGIKMVNACSFNNSSWVFVGGLTNAYTNIAITKSSTGQVWSYTNPAGSFPRSVGDTSAFQCNQ